MGCLRGGLAVIGAYIVMFVVMFVVFTGAYVILGTDGAFKPDSFEPSTVWIAISLVVGFLAAILGGWICTKISPSMGALMGLIVVIIVLGALQVVAATMAEPPGARDADLSNMEAMMQAVMPLWVAAANIVVGVVGVFLGGKGGAKSKG